MWRPKTFFSPLTQSPGLFSLVRETDPHSCFKPWDQNPESQQAPLERRAGELLGGGEHPGPPAGEHLLLGNAGAPTRSPTCRDQVALTPPAEGAAGRLCPPGRRGKALATYRGVWGKRAKLKWCFLTFADSLSHVSYVSSIGNYLSFFYTSVNFE